MKLNQLIRLFLVIFTFSFTSAWAQSPAVQVSPQPEKVRLQLKWFNQFQFAGYFAAIEKGYYAEEGLDVEIKERELEKNFVKQVTMGEAEYGVGDSGLLSQYAQGEPIVALAAIFQHSPLVFFSRQDSHIVSPYEMVGKRIVSDIISANEAPLRAMLADANVTEKDYTLIPQRNRYDLLVQGEVDVMSGYLTNEPFYFKERGVNINIINPLSYGIDFYGDILFTSRKELKNYPGRADRFRRASLKGWRYALEHPEELVQIISKKYHSKLSIEHLRFEAAETRKLILPEVIPLGQIELNRIKAAADTYANSGLNHTLTDAELTAFIYTRKSAGLNLTEQEQVWLNANRVIHVGIDRDFAPYEWLDEKGHYVGMAADYLRLLESKLGVRFEIIKNKSWAEVLNMAKRGELDMLSCAVKTPERSQYLTFTEPYKATYAVIIDNGQGSFIGSLDNLAGKRVSVEKGYFMQELLQKNHPKIQLVLAESTEAALSLVVDGKADAYVGDAGSANYTIKKSGLLSLRFSGQTNYRSQHSVAVIKSNTELASIMTKAMASIPQKEADAIFNRWLGLRIEQGVKPDMLVKYGLALTLLLMFFGYWIYRMKREIAIRKAAELREQSRSHIMEMLAKGAPLPTLLEAIVRSVEQLHPKMLCGILLLDQDRKHLIKGATPSLPDFYTEAISGMEVCIGVGSCGTAASTGQRVIVEDIATHPYWASYRTLAASAGLRACWSQPIYSSAGKVLGTFAVYHREVNLPTQLDIATIEQFAYFAGIAIERKQAEAMLQEREKRLLAIIENEPECIKIVDADGNLVEMNPAGLAMLEADSLDELSGLPVQDVIAPEYRLDFARMHKRVIAGESVQMEFEVIGLKGGRRWLETHAVPMQEQDGKIVHLAVTRDISESKRAEQYLRVAATVFESQEGMIVTDANNVILRVNNAFATITGYSAEDAVGKTPSLLNSGRQTPEFYAAMWASINNRGAWEGEIWNRRKNGEIYPEHLAITAVKDTNGAVTNYVATLTDITMSKAASEEIRNLAFYDPLTTLPNRRLLLDRLKQALASSARSGQRGALLFLDLDHFKTLNDTSGHDIGDLLLQQVAERLTTCVRAGDTVARIGGDEFVVLLEELNKQGTEAAAQTEAIGNKILKSLNQPYKLISHEYHCTLSIGATLFNGHQFQMEELLKQADIAMYETKSSGRNALRFFDPMMQEAINNRANIERELRNAIAEQQFQLYYQIQVDTAGHPLGAEALIRWQHPERGIVSPFYFISLAEETGLIVPIGQWVLETACAQLKLWQRSAATKHLTLSVNVSAQQFRQTDFVVQVASAIKKYDINPMLLKLELTESMLVDNVDNTIATINALKHIDIRFSLDDFGTGYSSLQYLKRLPLYQLKIDQSFVRDIADDLSDQAIVRTIIAMAHTLNLNVIAEGVETEEQRQLLMANGCNTYQGYLFSKPVPIDEFEALLK